MKCFYHTELDAVATCSQCGKASCRSCIEDIGGAMLCKGCLELHAENYAQQQTEIAEDRQAIMNRAKTRVWVAWGIAALGALIALASHDPRNNTPVVLELLVGAYGFWGSYWSIPRIWSWLKGLTQKMGFGVITSVTNWLIILVFFCSCFLYVAILYGIFGGGIYEFHKMNQIAKGSF